MPDLSCKPRWGCGRLQEWDRMLRGSGRYPFMRVPALLAVPLLLVGLAACSHQPSPDPAVSAFLDGWRSGQFKADLPLIASDGTGLSGTDVADKIKKLSGDLATVKPDLKAGGKAKITKNNAAAPIDVSWPIATGAT